MLSNKKVRPTLPASDMDRAKKFWGETIGLRMSGESPGGVMFDCGDGRLFVFPSSNAGSNPSTYCGFDVDDIEAEVAELKERGVEFLEYDDGPAKTTNSIANPAPNVKSAWFKDSEGNIIGLAQM